MESVREIKYRALGAASKEWVYGYYVVLDSGYELVDCIWQLGAKRATPIDYSTLGELTGLTDVNGREIYEHSELDGAYEVIFKDLRYSLRHIHNNDIIDLYDYWRDKNGEIEVTREYTKVQKNKKRDINKFLF